MLVVFISVVTTVKAQKIGDQFKDDKGDCYTIIRKKQVANGLFFELINDKNKESILMNDEGLSDYTKVVYNKSAPYTFNEISTSYQRYDKIYRKGKTIAIIGGIISAVGIATSNNKISIIGGVPMIIGCSMCTFTYPIPNKIRRRHK